MPTTTPATSTTTPNNQHPTTNGRQSSTDDANNLHNLNNLNNIHNLNKLLIFVHDNLTFENCGRFTLRHSHSVLSQFARKVQCEQVGLAASNFRKPEVSHLPPSQPPRQAGLESRPASLACSAPIYTESSETEKGSYDNDPRSVCLSVEPRAVRPNAKPGLLGDFTSRIDPGLHKLG